jgi:hypothetical protein
MNPFSMAKRVTPLYRAPESRYRKENSFAMIFAKELLPVEEYPSMAIIISGIFIYVLVQIIRQKYKILLKLPKKSIFA